ncbi:MAG: arginine--tRNA ligase [Armatimonadota bacterium]
MKSLREEVESAVRQGLTALLGPEGAELDPVVRPTQDPRFGDFQSNVAMGLAKRMGKKPREIAEELVRALDVEALCGTPEIAGPGFINFRVRPEFLAARLRTIQADPRLGIPPVEQPQRAIVDFSSPNLAKEMHIGHLRTTVIGDTIARLLEFLGHDVLRLNHVGDWGTQFGMLLQYVRETHPEVLENPEGFQVDDLEVFYRAAKARFDADPAFADAARGAVVELQSGEAVARKLWRAFCDESLRHAHEIYDLLGVRILDRGESFYNDMLPEVVRELEEKGLAEENQGAVCVFLEGWKNKEGEPLGTIIRKSDGGYMYATTDLAGIKQRVSEERADRIIYVTDVRQGDHFKQVFQIARRAGWAPESVALEHVGYGMILGADRKPFKTRSGDTVKLRDVIEEAIQRVAAVIENDPERREGLSTEQRELISRVVGIGAIKYADLSHNPSNDYVFDWDVMLALEGNAGPYMQFAYVRIRGIGRKAGVAFEELPADAPVIVEHETEIELAKRLLEFSGVVRQAAEELKPILLTDYLYSLSRAFSAFYDRVHGVRVIDAETEELRLSRLRLCDLTARTLQAGLGLLGIGVLEQM